jgi:ketosteroid isomerase-like protein
MSQEVTADAMRSLAHAVVDALNLRDFDRLQELLPPDVEFASALGRMEGEVHVGIDGFRQWAEGMDAIWQTFHVEVVDVRKVDEERAVVILRNIGVARTSGIPIDIQSGQVWIWRDGKPLRNESYTDPAEALAAVGLSE